MDTEVKDWMAAWMHPSVPEGVPLAPSGPLKLGWFADKFFFVEEPIGWIPNRDNPDQVGRFAAVTVPKGFVTDLASIPQPFWSLLPPNGPYAYAATVHDYLYWTQERPRQEADQILKFAMQDFKINNVTIATIYEAVNWFGGHAWQNNAALKARGEKRILKRWPGRGDETATWQDWKTRSDVFT